MKKFFPVIILFLSTGMAQAQLKVDTLGRVKVGHSIYNHDVSIGISGNHKYGLRNDVTNHTDLEAGLYNSVSSNQTDDVIGLFSYTKGPHVDSNHRIIAVKGFASTKSTTEGLPISVYGHLSAYAPPSHGVGVFGSTTSSFDNNWFDTKYAGFFNGLTKVRGNFIVTGNIQGTILGAPAASSESTLEENMEERYSSSVITSLRNLKANSFYKEIPEETLKAMNLNNASSQSKTIQIENMTDEEMIELEAMDKEAIPEISGIEKQILTKQHYGLSAEALEEVFPDLVYDNEDGTKSINYVEMVPILVQAINELNAKIEVLEGGDGGVKKAKSQATNIDEMAENITLLSLGQNKPNPFGTSTTIEISIPEDVQTAFIYVYDLTGKKLQQIDIAARGKQAVTLNAATLADGMYLYSLIADGKVVETRRMIVEK